MSKEKLPPKVRRRGSGYTYRYSVSVTQPDGTVRRKQKETRAFPTPQEAYREGIKIEAQLLEGVYVDENNMPFAEWAEKGLELHARAKGLKQSSVAAMRANLTYARAAFVGRKLKDITPAMYQQYLLDLRDVHRLSENTIKAAHSAMRILFCLAVKMRLIASNPTDGAVLPSLRPTFEALASGSDESLPEYLEKEQLAELVRVAKEYADAQTDPVRAFEARQMHRAIVVLAYTGLRIGELCALEEPRVDTRRGTIRIIATLYRGHGIRAYQLFPPKNRPSIRTVDISRTIASVLDAQIRDVKAFRLRCGERYHTERSFVFVNCHQHPGYPMNPVIFGRHLKRLLELAGLPPSITPHSLRHTFTSLSAEAGASLEDIQKQLGHASDDVTRRVYLHVTEARRRANVEKLDSLLSPYLRLD